MAAPGPSDFFSGDFPEKTMKPRPLAALALATFFAAGIAAQETAPLTIPFADAFTSLRLAGRTASRGPWKIADGVAACTQDDALYKQFKDHGPIIRWDLPFENARIRFRYRADASAKTFVFTANGETGHVFRFVTSAERGTDLRAFPPGGEAKSISIGRGGPKLQPGDWVSVVVELSGAKATVKIGDDHETTAEHPSLSRPKKDVSLGFSFGAVAIRDFAIEAL